MRASLIMIIITAVSICLFIPETPQLPPEADYANASEESEIYDSETEKLPALSENIDTQTTEVSYADIVLEEAFRTIRADYHTYTFISETIKDESENDINCDADNGSIQKDGDTQESKASSDSSVDASPKDAISGTMESETEALQNEATNTENNTSQESEYISQHRNKLWNQ